MHRNLQSIRHIRKVIGSNLEEEIFHEDHTDPYRSTTKSNISSLNATHTKMTPFLKTNYSQNRNNSISPKTSSKKVRRVIESFSSQNQRHQNKNKNKKKYTLESLNSSPSSSPRRTHRNSADSNSNCLQLLLNIKTPRLENQNLDDIEIQNLPLSYQMSSNRKKNKDIYETAPTQKNEVGGEETHVVNETKDRQENFKKPILTESPIFYRKEKTIPKSWGNYGRRRVSEVQVKSSLPKVIMQVKLQQCRKKQQFLNNCCLYHTNSISSQYQKKIRIHAPGTQQYQRFLNKSTDEETLSTLHSKVKHVSKLRKGQIKSDLNKTEVICDFIEPPKIHPKKKKTQNFTRNSYTRGGSRLSPCSSSISPMNNVILSNFPISPFSRIPQTCQNKNSQMVPISFHLETKNPNKKENLDNVLNITQKKQFQSKRQKSPNCSVTQTAINFENAIPESPMHKPFQNEYLKKFIKLNRKDRQLFHLCHSHSPTIDRDFTSSSQIQIQSQETQNKKPENLSSSPEISPKRNKPNLFIAIEDNHSFNVSFHRIQPKSQSNIETTKKTEPEKENSVTEKNDKKGTKKKVRIKMKGKKNSVGTECKKNDYDKINFDCALTPFELMIHSISEEDKEKSIELARRKSKTKKLSEIIGNYNVYKQKKKLSENKNLGERTTQSKTSVSPHLYVSGNRNSPFFKKSSIDHKDRLHNTSNFVKENSKLDSKFTIKSPPHLHLNSNFWTIKKITPIQKNLLLQK